MRRHPPLSLDQIGTRLIVDLETGRCVWRDATKHHARLNGKEAGSQRRDSRSKDFYWVIKINGVPYKRAQIVLMVKTGRWPDEMVDHRNGDKLDDRADNLRHATATQNNQNHRTRTKLADTPMGVRPLPSGRFQARIAHEKRQLVIGSFDTSDAAQAAYLQKRKELFREYA